VNETEQMQCRQKMRLIMIYSENVALARRKLEQMLFCRDLMMMKKTKNEKSMIILTLETYWEKKMTRRWWWLWWK